jgi:hypothetical protein
MSTSAFFAWENVALPIVAFYFKVKQFQLDCENDIWVQFLQKTLKESLIWEWIRSWSIVYLRIWNPILVQKLHIMWCICWSCCPPQSCSLDASQRMSHIARLPFSKDIHFLLDLQHNLLHESQIPISHNVTQKCNLSFLASWDFRLLQCWSNNPWTHKAQFPKTCEALAVGFLCGVIVGK